MKCSSGVYIQPYVASSAYQSAMIVQSPMRSASRLTSSQVSQNSSISARVMLMQLSSMLSSIDSAMAGQ